MAFEIRETKAVREAVALADLVAHSTNAIGEMVGAAGSGKSMAGRAIAARFGAVRLTAWEGMSRHQFLNTLAGLLGLTGPGGAERVLRMGACANECAPTGQSTLSPSPSPGGGGGHERRMLVVDEANKLTWRVLETVRYLADECGFAVILIGTEMYSRQFQAARTQPLLVQLGSRIGAKRMSTRHLDRAEVYAHVIKPTFGEVTDKELVTAFWTACRKGNFREAVELGEECQRLMATNGMVSLTPAVLELAGKWMANRYAG